MLVIRQVHFGLVEETVGLECCLLFCQSLEEIWEQDLDFTR
jgi:hypothetical protein